MSKGLFKAFLFFNLICPRLRLGKIYVHRLAPGKVDDFCRFSFRNNSDSEYENLAKGYVILRVLSRAFAFLPTLCSIGKKSTGPAYHVTGYQTASHRAGSITSLCQWNESAGPQNFIWMEHGSTFPILPVMAGVSLKSES